MSVLFILVLFIVLAVFGIRWAIKMTRKSKAKTKENFAKTNDILYSEDIPVTPTTVAIVAIIQLTAKAKPAVIEQLLSWTDTLKYPLKGNVLKLLQVALK
jgi:hypothetical protein